MVTMNKKEVRPIFILMVEVIKVIEVFVNVEDVNFYVVDSNENISNRS